MFNGGGYNSRLLNGGGQSLPIVEGFATFTVTGSVNGSARLANRGTASVNVRATVTADALITQVANFLGQSKVSAIAIQRHNASVDLHITGRLVPLATRIQQATATARIYGKANVSQITIGLHPFFTGSGSVIAYSLKNGVHEAQATVKAKAKIQNWSYRIRNTYPTFHVNGTLTGKPLPGRGSGATFKAGGTFKVNYFAKRPDFGLFTGSGQVQAAGVRWVMPTASFQGGATVDHLASRITQGTAQITVAGHVFSDGYRLHEGIANIHGRVTASATGRLGQRATAIVAGSGTAQAAGVRMAMGYATLLGKARVFARSRLNLQLPAPESRTFELEHEPRWFMVPESDRHFQVPERLS